MDSKLFAHVKWFTEQEPVKDAFNNILSPSFMFVAIFTAVLIALLPQVIPALMKRKEIQRIEKILASFKRYTPYLLRIGVSTALLLQIVFHSILAPEIELTTLKMWLGLLIAVLVLIPNRYTIQAGAVGILLLVILGVLDVGLFHMLDYGFYLAIAFALLLQHTKYRELGTPALYLGTGLSLCWVAVEKWVYPSMSNDIIKNHQVPTFGLEAESFIMLSAFIEFVVGYLLVVGLLNRSLALVLTLIFISTTTLFGLTEIVGHYMVHVILLIFIIEGTGFYKPPIERHDNKMDQIIFVFLNFIFVLATILLIYYRFA